MSGVADQFAGGCLCAPSVFLGPVNQKACIGAIVKVAVSIAAHPHRFLSHSNPAYAVTRGEITKFASTPGRTGRGCCGRCGSTLTCESAGLPTETHFHIGAFDRAAE